MLTQLRTASVLLTAALLMTACGSSDPEPPQAQRSDIALGAPLAGPTPFISFVPLSGQSLKDVTAYRYTITPKAGAVSRPVDVRYSAAALISRGYRSPGAPTSTLPVFGLYAGYTNQVGIELEFADGSKQQLNAPITAAAYVDPNAIYDRPNILVKRAAGGPSDLNYFFMKSSNASVIIADSDAQLRWVAPIPGTAYSSTFHEGAFIIGGAKSTSITRLELDGRTSSTMLAPSSANYTWFHHNLDRGKTGLLGELDGITDGVPAVESALVDFNPAGIMAKEWDLAAMVSRYMRQQGDDPTLFVRPGIDWFHINAATYDKRDDSVLVSSRENFVMKFDYNSGEIKWIFGDPTKYWYTFPSLRAKALTVVGGGLYPMGQHALSIMPDGRLLMFNNGYPSFRQPAGAAAGDVLTYSAVSAYDIDPVAMTAREAWRFDHGQSIYSPICSSAYLDHGGSMLINYASASGYTRARVVGLDPARTIMFDFEYVATSCATSWNAEPIRLDGMRFD